METDPVNPNKVVNGDDPVQNPKNSATSSLNAMVDNIIDKLLLTFGIKTIKYMVILVNVILFLLGLALIISGVAVVFALGGEMAGPFLEGRLNHVVYLSIAVGVVVVVLSMLGGFGAYRENKCLVMTYSVNLVLLLLLQIVAIVLISLQRSQLRSIIMEKMSRTLVDFTPEASKGSFKHTDAWNAMQTNLHCCGLTSYKNWMVNARYNGTGNLPDTCCVIRSAGCGLNTQTSLMGMETASCKDKFELWLAANIMIGVSLGVALLVFQLCAICCGCRLGRDIKRFYQDF